MYSFAFAVGPRASADALRQSLRRVEREVPPLSATTDYECMELADVGAAWVAVRPQPDYENSLLQNFVDPMWAVFTWGTLSETKNVARRIHAVVASGGLDSVFDMDGCFSAIIVNRGSGEVTVGSDLIGHRGLFYAPLESHTEAPTWIWSPHDLVLISARARPPELDPVSAASIALCDWSFGGRSLEASVRTCQSRQRLRCHRGQLSHTPAPALVRQQDRIEPRDVEAVRHGVEAVAAEYERRTVEFLQGRTHVTAALTAGMDSRLVWALLFGNRALLARNGADDALTTYTSGGQRSLDVRVARRLAAACGVPHRVTSPSSSSPEHFETTVKALAFHANGAANAKRALAEPPSLQPDRPFIAEGVGGEIIRGFFYPYFGASGVFPNSVEQISAQLVKWRFRRLGQSELADPQLNHGVVERLRTVLTDYARESDQGADWLDMLYVFERYGRWGARNAAVWNRRWSPFDSIGAVRAAFSLPAPLGRHCPVHALLVRRHLPPMAYWTPINGGQFLALEGSGRSSYALRSVMNAGAKGARLLRRKGQTIGRRIGLAGGAASSDVDSMRAKYFATTLSRPIAALLSNPDGVAIRLLGPQGVGRVLLQHQTQRDQLQLLGFLVTMEHWWQLACAVTDDISG